MGSIARVLQIELRPEDISATHGVPNAKKKTSITVKFVSSNNKMNWIIAARKKRGLKTTELSTGLKETYVFVNEHLSPYYKSILGFSKGLKKENKVAYVWVPEGKSLIRETPTSPIQWIMKRSDPDKYVS